MLARRLPQGKGGSALIVSVYLPMRNRNRLLSAAVNSVLRQDFQDFELVDDASSDETPQVLLRVQAHRRRSRRVQAPGYESQGSACNACAGSTASIIGILRLVSNRRTIAT